MAYVAVVAEDEELIREVAVEALEDAGFTVLAAQHAEEALKHLQEHVETIHLLFTDIHMPGEMNGLELAHHAKTSWPWVALLICSGRPRPKSLPEGGRFVAKPYEVEALINHTRELVGAED
jgi:two-component system, response regulator PdtaR